LSRTSLPDRRAIEISEWPRQGLIEPPVRSLTETAWESFPERLREEIERYLAGFKKIRLGVRGKRIRPCKESSIKTRRRELQAFARMAVRLGHPIETLTSLETMLDPALVEEVLEAYWNTSETDEPCVSASGRHLVSRATDNSFHARSIAAEAKSDMPHLASALLNHKHARITEEHYNRASSLRAASQYAEVILRKYFS
jgi:hypothetical protein